MIEVTTLQLEHHSPGTIGIGEDRPRLSWTFEGTSPNWMQKAYELEIRWQNETTESVRVETSDSYLGHDGTTSPWSPAAVCETGLLQNTDWSGSLIEPIICEFGQNNVLRPVIFSRVLETIGPVKRARLYITAHGLYEARINGACVTEDVLSPGWTSYHHRLSYQTYDITHLLDPKYSVRLEITVAEGWYCGRLGFYGGRRNIYGQSIGLLAQIYMESDSGDSVIHNTDNKWQCSYGPILSSSIYDGEIYDDETVEIVTSNTIRCLDVPKTLTAPDGPPVRRTEYLACQQIIRTPTDKFILDFGQNIAGWIQVNLEGLSPCEVTFQYAEVLDQEELGIRPLRTALARDVLRLFRSRFGFWEPTFTFHGFRYVQVDGWPGELKPESFKAVIVGTDMVKTGTFKCSNPDLNRLHSNIEWSMRSNFLSIPSDCPQRDERLGWTGDINMFANTANYLYDTSGMLTSWLKDLKAEQTEAGGNVPLTVPNVVPGLEHEIHAIWGDVAVMLPWSLYTFFGDQELLRRHFDSMEAWLQVIPRRSNGLWDYVSDWKLGDWLDPSAPADDPGNAQTDPWLVSDAFLVHVLSLMVRVCQTLGLIENEERYHKQHEQALRSFQDEYVSPVGRISPDTQTAYTLAVVFSLLTNEDQLRTAGQRLDWLIRRCSRFQITTGFAGTPLLGFALNKVGLSSVFYRMILTRKCPSWLYPITMGATTVWERWDSMLPSGEINPGEMTSFNHYALGSVAHWMHSTILGLEALAPGWQVYSVAPIPGGGLTWAEGSYHSRYGLCHIRWEVRQESTSTQASSQTRFHLSIRVPPNATAQVTLPGSKDVQTRGCGSYEWDVPFTPGPWPPRAIVARHAPPDDEVF